VSDTCSIDVSSGDPTINFSTEKATVDYTLGSCGGDQDLLLVSYESPCNGAASTGGQFDPANADQQTVFDTDTATTQSDGSLTVDVPPLPSGVPERGNAEAYIPLDTSAATNCRTGADATVFGSPSSGANGVSSNTNDAFSFDGSDDALQAGQNLPLNGPQATVAAWFKSPSFSTFEALFSINGGPNSTPKDNGGGYTVSFDGNEIRPTIWTSSSANFGGNKIALSTGTWYFAVAVADGNSCTLYVYDQTGELSSSPVTVDDSDGNGRTQTGDASLTTMVENGNWLPGNLDEVYGFSTALTTSEIDTLYNNSF
jgi:hypothetical protein